MNFPKKLSTVGSRVKLKNEMKIRMNITELKTIDFFEALNDRTYQVI